MILDPQNMGLDTLIVELCALLADIWRNIFFPVMASLICIQMLCGTFLQFKKQIQLFKKFPVGKLGKYMKSNELYLVVPLQKRSWLRIIFHNTKKMIYLSINLSFNFRKKNYICQVN